MGHIASTWFVCSNIPEKQASIMVVPLSDMLAFQSTRLLAGLSVPPIGIAHSFLFKTLQTNKIWND